MRRLLLTILVSLIAITSRGEDLEVYKLSNGQALAIRIDADGNRSVLTVLNRFGKVTVIDPSGPPPDPLPPAGPGQLICFRPWSISLDESDADLTIRESLDAAKSQVPYIRLLPETLNQRVQPHPAAEAYRKLAGDKAMVFYVVPTATKPKILHQGPLNADAVLGWVKVPKIALADGAQPDEARWLDVDFSKQQAAMLGMQEPPAWLAQWYAETTTNVRSLPGFTPIPKSEWAAWTARFPVTRLAKSIRNITEQTMGSCVGHACANGTEAGNYMQAGDLFFRKISGMSMYVRIGRSPGSGAYIPDAADEAFARGLLPVDGEPYPHTFPQDTDFYKKLPSGWESTAEAWKSQVYRVEDEESAFRVLMDLRLRTQFGRSSHSISGFAVTGNGRWAYENSWGDDWGDLGKSVGYDSRFYSSFVYNPVLRDEIKVLMAAELDQQPMTLEPPVENASSHMRAYRHFDDELQKIKAMLEEIKQQRAPVSAPTQAKPAEPQAPKQAAKLEEIEAAIARQDDYVRKLDAYLVSKGVIAR